MLVDMDALTIRILLQIKVDEIGEISDALLAVPATTKRNTISAL